VRKDISNLVIFPAICVSSGDVGEPVEEVIVEGLILRGEVVLALYPVAAGIPGVAYVHQVTNVNAVEPAVITAGLIDTPVFKAVGKAVVD
jgi:hypothetical protein